MDLERYSRQMIYAKVGADGQKKLLESKVAIVGAGALGTVIANNLCRAGVGYIRLIDRDYVELNNLQRQVLFDEDDAKRQTPKAVAAKEHLLKVNSGINLEPAIADVNSASVLELLRDVDLVVDGTDNMEVRYLINEACDKKGVPWIYGGALRGNGSTMNIIPGQTPCFSCVFPQPISPGSYDTCGTVGVLNMITGIIACIESCEAIKILTGSPDVRKSLLMIDIWNNSTDYVDVDRIEDCPVCAKHQYRLLGRASGAYSMNLCGRDSVQIVPGVKSELNFVHLAERLKTAGNVEYNNFMLRFDGNDASFNLFPDGRAIIKNVHDEKAAKSVYSEYIGM